MPVRSLPTVLIQVLLLAEAVGSILFQPILQIGCSFFDGTNISEFGHGGLEVRSAAGVRRKLLAFR